MSATDALWDTSCPADRLTMLKRIIPCIKIDHVRDLGAEHCRWVKLTTHKVKLTFPLMVWLFQIWLMGILFKSHRMDVDEQ